MEKELQNKIAWFEKRHAEHAMMVEKLENDRRLDRSTTAQAQLRYAKKEKLRMKDQLELLRKLDANRIPEQKIHSIR